MFRNRFVRGIILSVVLLGLSPTRGQTNTSAADIFFLDLGIVIEPRTGKEVYNRLVNPNSEEIKLRIKKVESGSVYMATSKEMLNALQRIQQRMDVLEQSFQSQISMLRDENQELKGMLADIKTPVPVTPAASVTRPATKPDIAPVKEPPKKNITVEVAGSDNSSPVAQSKKVKPAPEKKPALNYSEYMAAVFAYQREDYRVALKHFNNLDLALATPEIAANILYWSADAHSQLGEPYQALSLLDQLLSRHISSDRVDDALVQKGLLYRKTGQDELALAAFHRLVQEFPSSEYSRLASMELKKADIIP
ncbi:MAG: tetratricopeptide repeat protein [FCB group bacterium]|nr:tetratricopeptide repeat protein [FCB group bacterium]